MIEIIKTRKFKAGYELRTERYSGDDAYGSEPFNIVNAYTSSGHYIGTSKWAYRLAKLGIKPELRTPYSRVCAIGFSEREQKWFGWSHRATMGFGVGSKVSKGDIAFVPSSLEEHIEQLLNWYTDPMYSNVRVVEENGNLVVKYVYMETERAEGFEEIQMYGHGEWTAQSLEDAKEMACAFSESVS